MVKQKDKRKFTLLSIVVGYNLFREKISSLEGFEPLTPGMVGLGLNAKIFGVGLGLAALGLGLGLELET